MHVISIHHFCCACLTGQVIMSERWLCGTSAQREAVSPALKHGDVTPADALHCEYFTEPLLAMNNGWQRNIESLVHTWRILSVFVLFSSLSPCCSFPRPTRSEYFNMFFKYVSLAFLRWVCRVSAALTGCVNH